MASFTRDLRYALRVLRKSPGYTFVALLTLAIGIGANSAIFSFVDGMLLKPLPYPDADRIVRVMEKPPQGERNSISTLNFLDWQRDNTAFDFLAAQAGGGATLTGVSEPVQLRGARVSADYFRIFRIEPALGRTFAPGEDELGKHRVVILSRALWVSQFGADPGIVNRPIRRSSTSARSTRFAIWPWPAAASSRCCWAFLAPSRSCSRGLACTG